MVTRAEALPVADASVDHLTVTYLLRYVDDEAATLRELARTDSGIVVDHMHGPLDLMAHRPPSPPFPSRPP